MRPSHSFWLLGLFCLFVGSSFAAITPPTREYKELTADNFESSIRENPYVVLVFYDSEAPDARKIISEIQSFRASLGYVTENTMLASLDIRAYPEIAKQNSVKSLPDIRMYVYGIPVYYTKSDELLSASNIHRWVIENIRKKSKDISAEKSLSTWNRERVKYPLQLFYVGKTTSPSFSLVKRFASIAGTGVHVKYVLITQTEWLEFFKVKDRGDHLYFISEFTGEITEYKGDLTLRDLYQFVDLKKYPEFYWAESKDPRQYADIYREKRPVMFLMLPETYYIDDEIEYMAEKLESFAKKHVKGEIPCVFVHLKKDESETYLWNVNITEASVLIIENLNNRLYHVRYIMKGELTEENMLTFYNQWKEGKAPRHYKSQVLVSEKDENGIPYLTRSNFKEIIFNSGKDVFVYFYSVWGSNAKNNMNVLLQVNAFVQNSYLKNKVMLVRCDMAQNDIPGIVPAAQRASAFSRKSAPGEWIKSGELKSFETVLELIEKHTTAEKPKDDL